MGQKVSIEAEDENELFNIFQLHQRQASEPVKRRRSILSIPVMPAALVAKKPPVVVVSRWMCRMPEQTFYHSMIT